ncbi:uncharacterized protein I206_106931 [Kwoniella pini CBS 10737]|uniref:F-box domain-containing protein n=1 Tax=Kwoniella pini CBS 10737 TaxID=1296096 RepID=A0A1B9HZQ7_9TREE|nr:uncharacterized protein I206_05525 [Kwoniella pini CBS 10737]OCF48744.1 hypothetical protein I206_05525 [Kwoniella pini CBS 10737]
MPRKPALVLCAKPPYPPSTSPIEQLPSELKLRVVSYLTKSDANNLAITSRSLQDAAESSIWSTILISMPEKWEYQKRLWEKIRILGGWKVQNKLTPENEDLLNSFNSTMTQIDWSSIQGEPYWEVRCLKFLARINQVLSALERHSARISWIKKLELDFPQIPGDPFAKYENLHELIKLIRNNLRIFKIGAEVLDLRLMDTNHKSLEPCTSDCFNHVGFTALHSLKLHTLDIDLSEFYRSDCEISRVLQIAGDSVQYLILGPNWSELLGPRKRKEAHESINLSLLKSLTLHHLDPRAFPAIYRIIKAAPYLENLSIHCSKDGGAWADYSEDLSSTEVKTLREHNGLKRVEWYGGLYARWCFEKISEEGFDNVKITVQNQDIGSESETYIENILVPPFASLKVILVPCRTTKWSRHLAAPDWAKAPPPRNSISPHVINHLRQAPNLLAIQFSCLSNLSIEEALDSSKWNDKRVNGVLIRCYTNQATGEEFYHFKRLELLTVQPKIYDHQYAEKYETMRKAGEIRWVDHTSFRNATVPPPILNKVYKLLGQSIEWQEPGRNMELPESAWQVLRLWRVKLPDKGLEGRKMITRKMARSLQ